MARGRAAATPTANGERPISVTEVWDPVSALIARVGGSDRGSNRPLWHHDEAAVQRQIGQPGSVLGDGVTCRPHGGTYIEYGFLGVLVVLALGTLVLAATASQAIALAVGAIAAVLCLWRIARTGMRRDGDDLVVVNLFRTYRVPIRHIGGYRYPAVSFSLGKQSGVILIMKSGARMHARMLDYGAGEWLDAQAVGKVSHKDS